MYTIKTSVFTDCASDTIVVRAPYKNMIDAIKNMEDSKIKEELLDKMRVATRRSKKMTNYFLGQENP
mgnify:CR=1 FL=1|jgi:hypothetical protein|nr:MAG TPA: hypothetical protein [Caudoviricetes sp.]